MHLLRRTGWPTVRKLLHRPTKFGVLTSAFTSAVNLFSRVECGERDRFECAEPTTNQNRCHTSKQSNGRNRFDQIYQRDTRRAAFWPNEAQMQNVGKPGQTTHTERNLNGSLKERQ